MMMRSVIIGATALVAGMVVGCSSTAEVAEGPAPLADPLWSGSGEPGRVVGIGGVFFRTDDRAATAAWYAEAIGMPPGGAPSTALLFWRDAETGTLASTTWGPFARGSDYFDASQSYMVNYVVDDLDAARARLAAAGARVDEKVESYDFGRFGWFWDPNGVKCELWEPNAAFIRDGYAAMRSGG